MRRFTKQLHHVISLFIAFLQRGVDTIFPSRPLPATATTTPGGKRRPRVRGVHAVPLVAVLALGATAFAVNSGATPDATPVAVGDQVPHSTPTTENPAELERQANIEKLAAAEEKAAAEKAAADKAAMEKAAADKAAADKAAMEHAAIEKLAAAEERAAAEQAEAERNAQAAQQQSAPQPVSASGACGGNLPPCCVMMRESGGNPTVVNASSGAAGKWQFMTSTWANYKGYPTAAAAPEHVQDERAAQLWAGGAGAGHWGGGCW